MFATTTPATAEYLTYMTDAAMRCTTQGNCFPRDANTVMHCNGDEFTGSVLRCGVNTGADPWTTNGTVTLNAPSFHQNVNAQRIAADGAGTLSDTNYFRYGTGAAPDVFDFAGSFLTCAAFDSLGGSGTVLSGGYDASTNTGWAMTYVSGSGKLQCVVAKPAAGAATVDTSNYAATDGSLNLGCCGWDRNGTIYAMLNASAVATGPGDFIAASGTASYIGRRVAAGAPLPGRVYEILAINKAPTTAQLETIQRRWLNHQSLTGQALTNTHTADTSMYHSAGKPWRRGANVQRQESAGTWIFTTTTLQGVQQPPTPSYRTSVPPGFRVSSGVETMQIWPYGIHAYTSGVTFTNNAALAPDGTMTATAVRETNTNGPHDLFAPGNISATGPDSVYSVYIRPVGARPCLFVYNYNSEYYNNYVGMRAFDSATDTIVNVGSGGTAYPRNIGAEKLAGGWYRIWVGYAHTDWSQLQVSLRARPDCTESWSWQGDDNAGFDYWNPMFESGRVTPSTACTTGASNVICTAETVTVPNPLRPNGSDWTNLAVQSEDFKTTWLANGATVTANTGLGPDGSFTADRAVLPAITGVGDTSIVFQGFTATAAPWVGSVYVRGVSGAGTVYLTLTDASTAEESTSTPCVVNTTTFTRCSVTRTLAAATRYFLVGMAGAAIYGQPSSQPAITVELYGAQVETGSTPSPYCPTTTAARTCGPGGATGKTVTNLIKYSTAWDTGSAWMPAGAAVTGNDRVGRTPGTFGDTVTVTVDGASKQVRQDFTATASRYTASFWIQGGTVSSATFGLYQSGWVAQTPAIVEGPGTIAGTTTVTVSGLSSTEWTRVKTTTDAALGAAGASFYLYPRATVGQLTGDSVGVQDAQLEESAAAGPYCGPTGAASRTCAPTQRWCVRVTDATPGYGRPWTLTTGTVLAAGGAYNGANSWNVQAYGTKIYLDSRGGDAVAISMNADHTFTDGSTHTIVACANNGVGTLYYDGSFTPAGTGAVATFSAWPTSAFMGSVAAGVYSWDGTIGSLEFNTTGDPRDFVWDRRTP